MSEDKSNQLVRWQAALSVVMLSVLLPCFGLVVCTTYWPGLFGVNNPVASTLLASTTLLPCLSALYLSFVRDPYWQRHCLDWLVAGLLSVGALGFVDTVFSPASSLSFPVHLAIGGLLFGLLPLCALKNPKQANQAHEQHPSRLVQRRSILLGAVGLLLALSVVGQLFPLTFNLLTSQDLTSWVLSGLGTLGFLAALHYFLRAFLNNAQQEDYLLGLQCGLLAALTALAPLATPWTGAWWWLQGLQVLACALPIVLVAYSLQRITGGADWLIRNPHLAREALKTLDHKQTHDFELIFNSVPLRIWFKDVENRIIRLNQAAADLLGVSIAEAEGSSLYTLYPERAAYIHDADLDVIVSGKPKLGHIEAFTNREGETRWVQSNRIAYRNEADGSIQGVLVVAQDITELLETQEALRASQERYRLALESSRDGVWDWDLKTETLFYSEQLFHLLGYELGLFKPTLSRFEALLHPEDKERVMDALFEKALKSGRPYQLTYRLQHQHGHYLWVRDRGQALLDEAGQPTRMLGVISDISHEVSLKALKEQRTALLENMVEGICELSEHDHFETLNEAFCQMSGFSREDLKGLHISHTIAPDSLASFKAALNQLRYAAPKQQGRLQWEGLGLRADGSTYWQEVTLVAKYRSPQQGSAWVAPGSAVESLPATEAYPDYSEPPEFCGYYYFAKDVSVESELREALASQAQRYKAIFEQTLQHIWLLSSDARLIQANQAALNHLTPVFGASLDEQQQVLAQQLFWDTPWWAAETRDRDLVAQAINDALDQGVGRATVTLQTRHAPGSLELDFSIKACYDEQGAVAYLLAEGRDVSQLKQAEQTLLKLNERLLSSNQDLQQFASIAAHDLKEPLRKVLSYASCLEVNENSSLSPEDQDALKRLQGAVSRLQHLMDSLLVYTQVSTRHYNEQWLPLDEVLDEVLEDLAPEVKQQEATVLRKPMPSLLADRNQMRQLFQNLLSNALKFSDPQRPLTLTLQPYQREDESWEFQVVDTGIGFEQQYASQIFNVFTRLHSRQHYQGTGIGLAICQKIALRHDGIISVQSTPGVGSVFKLRVPSQRVFCPQSESTVTLQPGACPEQAVSLQEQASAATPSSQHFSPLPEDL